MVRPDLHGSRCSTKVRTGAGRVNLKRLLFLLLVLTNLPLFSQQAIEYSSVENFLKLPPDRYLGEMAGVAVNSKGHVFALSRGNTTGPAYGAAASQLLEFGPDGKFVREIGRNLYAWSFGHSVKVDPQDNLWVADKGSDMVIKFDPEGRVVMVFGRKQEASDEGTEPLKHPKPPLAPVDAKGNVYVADRGNRRIQVFDGEGNFLRQITIDVPFDPSARPAIGPKPAQSPSANGTMQAGSPWAICITPGPNQVLFSSDAYPGRIYKLSLDGKVLGYLGESGKQLKQFGWIHEIACPSENELYVAELLNWRVQKLILKPTR